jgi:hypothetical protein
MQFQQTNHHQSHPSDRLLYDAILAHEKQHGYRGPVETHLPIQGGRLSAPVLGHRDRHEHRRGAVNKPTKAVLYAAKSTEDKHGSIPDQLNDGRKLASERDLDAVAEYSDEAASAYHGDRGPGLERAMAHCQQIAPCALIVQHSDRLARGDAKQARHLIEHGVGVSVARRYEIKRIDLDYFGVEDDAIT